MRVGWRENTQVERKMGSEQGVGRATQNYHEHAGTSDNTREVSKNKVNRLGLTLFYWWWGATPYQFDSLQRALATKGGCGNLQESLVCAASYQEFPWLFYRR
jgi:hypothetical protein